MPEKGVKTANKRIVVLQANFTSEILTICWLPALFIHNEVPKCAINGENCSRQYSTQLEASPNHVRVHTVVYAEHTVNYPLRDGLALRLSVAVT